MRVSVGLASEISVLRQTLQSFVAGLPGSAPHKTARRTVEERVAGGDGGAAPSAAVSVAAATAAAAVAAPAVALNLGQVFRARAWGRWRC